VGREDVVGQGFPVGKGQQGHVLAGQEEAQGIFELLGLRRRARDHQQRPVGFLRRRGDGQRRRVAVQMPPVADFTGLFGQAGVEGADTVYGHEKAV